MYIVILAGGSGTRFWPLSRVVLPKQLISITGDRSMLQRTVERVLPLNPERIFVITNQLQAEETKRQMQPYNQIPVDVVSEPVGRNTAPAIALAAALVTAYDPSGVMAVLPADHFIKNEKMLCDTLTFAESTAREGFLVTLGILPSRPETGYGYIEADMTNNTCSPFTIRRFVEKPPLAEALRYLDEGNFFWNSGMFVWRADTILAEMKALMPTLHQKFTPLLTLSVDYDENVFNEYVAEIYNDVESISIDYGIMERSDIVKMMPVEMGWSDVGSWSALPEVVEPDASGTVCINAAGHVSIDSSDCLIYADNRMIATVGVSNIVLVSTPDALLLCDRERCQDVKKVVEQLGLAGFTEYL